MSNQQEPSIVLPVIALVSIFVCWPIGLILAIVSLVKYADAKNSSARTLSIVAVVLCALGVPIMGVMAAIAIPNFVKFQCRSKQSEAKGNLKALYVAEEGFRAGSDRYSTDLAEIEYAPRGAKLRYDYVVVEATPTGFRAEARGKDEMKGDLWIITNTNELQNVENVCH